MADTFQIRVISSLGEIPADIWDALIPKGCADDAADISSASASKNPFVRHGFLYALEQSNSACLDTGWLGQHLILEDASGNTLGAVPCYLKNHSQGEYVFDHGWADAFMRAGGDYYPKLQCSVPFTPATGPRFLVHQGPQGDAARAVLAQGLCQLTDKIGASSAHVTFLDKTDWDFLGDHKFLRRTDQQFHWHNRGYQSFDDFLDGLSSRKRKNIRKERTAALQETNIEIEWLTGDQLTEDIWDIFFEFYIDTGSRKWGSPYLTRAFYTLVGEAMADDIVLIMAKRGGEYIAGAINFIGDNCLYGRHWGCLEDHPFLHFEICYYQAIEYAIQNRLSRVEAGAQGPHKLARGYEPVTTYSAHWIAHPGLSAAVADYLEQERQHIELENNALMAHTPFKKTS